MSAHAAAARKHYEALCAESAGPPPITASQQQTLATVAALLGTTPPALIARTRGQAVNEQRREAMALLRRRGYSQPLIGRLLQRDPSSVLAAVRTVEALVRTDPAYAARIDRLARASRSVEGTCNA
jgi:chromosomal replication initiation ATPase DnaA